MYDVFISYSSGDREWAEKLEANLKEIGLQVFRDRTRLAQAQPFQEQLFRALEESNILVIFWSERVRKEDGLWSEWVITERERFRSLHPNGPIIYLLLDHTASQIDAHSHKLDELQGTPSPNQVNPENWEKIVKRIRESAFSDKIEITSYIFACKKIEFDTLIKNQNLNEVLGHLKLDFHEVSNWYGENRVDWKPAGGPSLGQTVRNLETNLTEALCLAGVPDRFKNKSVFAQMDFDELWSENDGQVKKEVERLCKVDYAWFFIDPLSLYHKDVLQVAQR